MQTAKESAFLNIKGGGEDKGEQEHPGLGEWGEEERKAAISPPMGSKRSQQRVKPGPCSFVNQRYPF